MTDSSNMLKIHDLNKSCRKEPYAKLTLARLGRVGQLDRRVRPACRIRAGRLRLDEVQCVHLTFLDSIKKAPIAQKKIMHGSCKGRPIVLAPPNDGLALCIAEGIESALSIHAVSGMGAWAAGSAVFMPDLADVMPDWIECVTIWAEKGRAGQDGRRSYIDAYTKEASRFTWRGW